MAGAKQIAANRRNARKSTGPRSPEGKARASKNAIKHGILSEDTVIQGESRERFEAFRAQMTESLQPVGAVEELLVNRIVDCAWRLQRFLRFQRKTLDRALEELTDKALSKAEEHDRDHLYYERIAEMDGDSLDEETREEIAEEVHAEVNLDVEDLEDPPEDVDAFWDQDYRLDSLYRYETALERSMTKALHELQRLQAARQNGPAAAPMAFDFAIEVPGGGNSDGQG